jgi:hypothetical protein
MRVVVATVVLLIIGVLLVSLISKLRSRAAFREFADALAALRVIPGRWALPLAWLSVAAEAAVFGALLWPGGTVVGLAGGTVLFAGFTAGLAVAVRRGATVGCHCFGATSAPVARRHVVRSGFLSAAALGALCVAATAHVGWPTGLPAAQLIVALAAAGLLVAALVWLDELRWLFRGAASTS